MDVEADVKANLDVHIKDRFRVDFGTNATLGFKPFVNPPSLPR